MPASRSRLLLTAAAAVLTLLPAIAAPTQAAASTTAAPAAASFGPRTGAACGYLAPSPDDRVQVVYEHVGSSGSATDTLAAATPQIQQAVHEIDDIFVASAARSGGSTYPGHPSQTSRQVRWVTDQNCQPTIQTINVASFGDAWTALSAAPWAKSTWKYLIFSDANLSSGGATTECGSTPMPSPEDEQPGLANAFNSGGPAWTSTVYRACWPNDGTDPYYATKGITAPHSSAAHELMHNLGAVLPDAPHSTASGHCTDEADIMCYPFPGDTMSDTCPVSQENLFDCNGDDYFNTDPRYVSTAAVTHGLAGKRGTTIWNTASSSYLLVPPAPGAPALTSAGYVAGEPAVLTPQVQVPSGQGYRLDYTVPAGTGCSLDVTSSVNKADGTLVSPTTTLRCPVGAATTQTLTTTLTQQDGQSSTSTASLTDRGVSRTPTVQISSDSSTVIAGATVTLTAHVTDPNTGAGVWGVPIHFTGRDSNGTQSIADGVTDATGTASATATVPRSATFTASTDHAGDFAASSGSATVTAVIGTSTSLTSGNTWVPAGQNATVSGTLTTLSGAPLSGQIIALWAAGASSASLQAFTDSNGSVSFSVPVNSPTSYQLQFSGTADYQPSSSGQVTLAPSLSTTLTQTLSTPAIATGTSVTVTGALTDPSGQGAAGQSVSLYRQDSGSPNQVLIATSTTDANGNVTFTDSPTGDTSYQLQSTATGKYLAATSTSATVAVRQPLALTLTNPGTVSVGSSVQLTATATSAGTPVCGATVSLRTGGPSPTVLDTETSDANGQVHFQVNITSTVDLTATTDLTSIYLGAASPTAHVTAQRATQLTNIVSSASVSYGQAVTITATLSATSGTTGPLVGKILALAASTNGAPARQIATATSNSAGQVSFVQSMGTGTRFWVTYAGGADTAPASGAPVAVAVSRGSVAGVAVGAGRVNYGSRTSVTGYAVYAGTASKIPGMPIQLWQSSAGGAWTHVSSATTNSAGVFTWTIAPAFDTTYQIRYPATAYNGLTLSASNSAAAGIHVIARAAISTPLSVRAGARYTVTGTVSPALAGRLVWFRIDGRSVAHAYTDRYGRFSLAVSYGRGYHTIYLNVPSNTHNDAVNSASYRLRAY